MVHGCKYRQNGIGWMAMPADLLKLYTFFIFFDLGRCNWIYEIIIMNSSGNNFQMSLLRRYGTSRCLTVVQCANRRPRFSTLCAVPVAGRSFSGLDLAAALVPKPTAGLPTCTDFPLNQFLVPISCQCNDFWRSDSSLRKRCFFFPPQWYPNLHCILCIVQRLAYV